MTKPLAYDFTANVVRLSRRDSRGAHSTKTQPGMLIIQNTAEHEAAARHPHPRDNTHLIDGVELMLRMTTPAAGGFRLGAGKGGRMPR